MTDLRKWSENAFVMLAGLKESVQWELAPAIMKEIKELVDAYPVGAAPSEGVKAELTVEEFFKERFWYEGEHQVFQRKDMISFAHAYAQRLSPARSGEPPAVDMPQLIAQEILDYAFRPTGGVWKLNFTTMKAIIQKYWLRPYFSPASTQSAAALSLEECAKAAAEALNAADLLAHQPYRGAASTKTLKAVEIILTPYFTGAVGQPLLDKLRAIVFDQDRDVEYGTPEYFLLQRLRTAFTELASSPSQGWVGRVSFDQ